MEEYFGKFSDPRSVQKEKRKKPKHPIFLFEPNMKEMHFDRLTQVVNIYEHTLEDFELNAERLIEHEKKYLGDIATHMFTLGQCIRFRVYKDQEPFDLPLYKFLINYTMLAIPILMGANMKRWTPWVPEHWSSKGWCNRVDYYIRICRRLGNSRKLCELIEASKYLVNLWAVRAGDRLALSISNNEFIEVTKRSKTARECISCTYDIPKDITPAGLEELTKKKTHELLSIISNQKDLSIATYASNGLFNPGQFREYAVHIGHKPDLNGNTIPFTAPTNILMGTKDPRAYTIDAHGGRKAELIKLKVADAGTLERSLCMLLSDIKRVDNDYECDSKHYRVKKIMSQDDLINLEGRVYTLDQDSDVYYILDPYDPEAQTLIGKTIYVKTPITCTHPDRANGTICSACYGKLLGALNNDVHIGRLSALNSADDIEQGLLSAKHALLTNTDDVQFDDSFYDYFDFEACQIYFNQLMIDASSEHSDEFNNLYLEFNLNTIKKNKDGENRHHDRSVTEIVIYDRRDESRIVISEKNGLPVYLSPEFNEYFFLEAAQHADDVIQIPFSDLIDGGKVCCDVLFEYEYKNNELADALMQLEAILTKESSIDSYETYNECLDSLIPLFIKGGIKLPEIHIEMIVSQLIFNMDGKRVDWTEEDPKYRFYSITKAILTGESVVTSLLYREPNKQIMGKYNAYNKSGISDYDYFLLEDQKDSLQDVTG